MRLVLVGQAPSRTSDPRRPLSGKGTGRRISSLLGMEEGEYLRSFCRKNVLGAWPGSAGEKGDAFPAALARERASAMRRALSRKGRVVVFVGKKTAESFGHRAGFLEWAPFGKAVAATLPHPSGINLWWNSPANTEKARTFLRDLLTSVKLSDENNRFTNGM